MGLIQVMSSRRVNVAQIHAGGECEEGARDFARIRRAGGPGGEWANWRLRERAGGDLWPQRNPKHDPPKDAGKSKTRNKFK